MLGDVSFWFRVGVTPPTTPRVRGIAPAAGVLCCSAIVSIISNKKKEKKERKPEQSLPWMSKVILRVPMMVM